MIDIEFVKKKYSSMSNEHLIEYAKKEQSNLIDSAIELLRTEIQRRGLDDSFLRRPSADSHQKDEPSYWRMAFEVRKSGKTKEETINELIRKGLNEVLAHKVLESVPNFDYQNKQFDELILKRCSDASFKAHLALFFAFGTSAFLLFTGITTFSLLFILLGVVFVVIGYIMYSKSPGEFKGAGFWLELIKNNQDKIVWIKPITEKHTIGFVITLFEVKKIQFLTRDDISVTMECDTDEELKIFFEGIKNYLPHVHFGYNIDVLSGYPKNRG